ncbi:MAG: hypothetical protein COV69_01980 [Parcubacteria group bacterium CG11_big_fil_rev_8_21_14_0_20_39_14]|nr:MAG: hypothetical protein COV69_01980 [Parcubacteria group bacterium CG11_big_fil_rev_8_21_14_0_20_39_14]PIS35527.1 MAG: hypothetical protein COT36_01880 [Parcubacteria group bacterium CG08_land_8_20_14_0_20_38_56]
MLEVFNTLLYQPLFNILIFLYNIVPLHDLGISIIILTLIIRILISPLSIKSFKAQKVLSELQPKIKEVQAKYKGNPQKQNEELMKLYKGSKTNPFSGCLPLLIQMPIFIALFQILKGLENPEQFSRLYSFVRNPGILNTTFLGIVDLAQESKTLAIFAGLFQFIQSKMLSSWTGQPKNISKKDQTVQMTQLMTKQMTYFMPVFLVFIAWSLPAALPLYWIIITLFSIGEQYYLNKISKSKEQRAK